ncbi:DASH family cryptochrome [Mucilaginibacter sp. Bleaf8]|uniref:DASH family cryptochrome n=1 Tax=Mucilaginibacter sp. Bleaf8 TaxID=2834430 RepID=UPI001BCC29CD|nr:DASH family cryptochrome [Mucilaginibacter sp. Bleaf8]MBS7564288.1 DASH family cryptochrome [Mucilaginibacter sp. Bleaf8]
MSDKTILVWFRNDLRVHDNEILLEATRKADKILPVYCFDPHYFQASTAGSLKTGSIRARFLIESVADLRTSLRNLGGELVIVQGNPAELIPQLAEQYQVSEVYHHREVAFEETGISEEVEAALWKMKLNLKHFIGHTLYHKEDLPFPIKDIPDSFNTFKKKVERDSNVRPCVQTPEAIHIPDVADAGEVPSLEQLGLTEPFDDARAYRFVGGETAALQQLDYYFTHQPVTIVKKGSSAASRLSPWLAMGCISPRQVYWELVKHGQNVNNHPLMLELLWRDYFRFMFKKHSSKFYSAAGFKNTAPELAANQDELFEQWKAGRTGVPYIDACMHELNATGFIHNSCRQVVAAYLTKELKVDWTRGAQWFEEKLIDYSPASNWGNWAYIAGVGNDPRENRYFNPKTAAELDPKGEYVKLWLNEEADSKLAASA